MPRDRRTQEGEGSSEGPLDRISDEDRRALIDQLELQLKDLRAGVSYDNPRKDPGNV